MYTTAATSRTGGFLNLLRQIEAWLDSIGRGAWIALMVLGFMFTGPFGLILLAYMIWGKKMFGSSCRSRARHQDRNWSCDWSRKSAMGRPTGNATFDAYKTDTLRRLEEEQGAFEAFLQRLRDAKDKTEFDSFMDDRARQAEKAPDTTPAAPIDARQGEY